MAKPVYVDIAKKVSRIAMSSGYKAAGKYLEDIMEEELEKLRKEIRESEGRMAASQAESESRMKEEIRRIAELAGIAKE